MKTFERKDNNKFAVVVVALGVVWLICIVALYEHQDFLIAYACVMLGLTLFWAIKVPPDFSYKVEEIENRLWIQKGEDDRQFFDKQTMYIAVKWPKYLVIKDRSGSSAKLYYNKAFLAFLRKIEESDC